VPVPLIIPVAAPVLVPFIIPVAAPVLVPGCVPVLAPLIIPVLGPVLAPCSAPVLVRLIMLVLVPCIVPILVPLIMLALVPSIMPILVPLIMLVLVPWPHTVEGPGDGLPRGPAATAVDAPRAITPAAKAPTIRGRLNAGIFCRRAPYVPISLFGVEERVSGLGPAREHERVQRVCRLSLVVGQ
jgi:hypothetical protein